MADTGWILCGTGSNDQSLYKGSGGSGKPWTNPNNIASGDTAYAVNSLIEGYSCCRFSDALRASNFGFTLPIATIDGIHARYRRKGYFNYGGNIEIREKLVDNTSTQVGNNKASGTWTGSYVLDTMGGASDLWGWGTPTYEKINSSNFGWYHASDSNNEYNSTPQVEYVEMRIYYTPTPQQSMLWM